MRSEHHYALAFRHADGTPAGQVPIEVDWEPATEAIRFGVFCRCGTMPRASVSTRIAPVWHRTAGEPHIEGIRVSLEATGEETGTQVFPLSYFGNLVLPAVQQLVEKELAVEGETLKYQVVAFPQRKPSAQPQAFVSREISAAPVCRQTSLDQLRGRAVAIDEDQPDPDHLPVFVRPGVIRDAEALATRAGSVETGGILVGYLHRDRTIGRVFVEVTAQIAAQADGSSTALTFTPQTWTDASAALDLRGRGELMLGWWHSHPVKEWCKSCPPARQRECALRQGFFSADDQLLHRTVFPRAYSVALLLSDTADLGVTYRAFGWKDGVVRPRGFFLLDPSEAPPVVPSRSEASSSRHPSELSVTSPSCETEKTC